MGHTDINEVVPDASEDLVGAGDGAGHEVESVALGARVAEVDGVH